MSEIFANLSGFRKPDVRMNQGPLPSVAGVVLALALASRPDAMVVTVAASTRMTVSVWT